MKPEEAIHHIQAYLDHELDPVTRAAVEVCLANDPQLAELFEQEREFHAFLKERSAKVEAPSNLLEGIKARMANAQTQSVPMPNPARRQFLSRRGWLMMAASVAIVAGLGMVALKPVRECPYMVSCAQEHEDIVSGKCPTLIQSSDPAKLAAAVDEKLKLGLKDLPVLTGFDLKVVSAGISSFDALKKAGSPDAAFVLYTTPTGESATLFIHPWAAAEPEAFNKTQFQGKPYWAATHKHESMAVWKSDDGKLLMSVVTTRSKDETLRIADVARSAMSSKQAARSANQAPVEMEVAGD